VQVALVVAFHHLPAAVEIRLDVGYSLGATLAENLVQRWPERYDRVALIGSPRDPRPDRLKTARAVATLSCSRDVPQRMRGAVTVLGAAGVSARYFEMPGCTHGNLADGDRVFDDVLTWLAAGGDGLKPLRPTPFG
jgi:pimeloyl-ACP methyl ester carboxylesterase